MGQVCTTAGLWEPLVCRKGWQQNHRMSHRHHRQYVLACLVILHRVRSLIGVNLRWSRQPCHGPSGVGTFPKPRALLGTGRLRGMLGPASLQEEQARGTCPDQYSVAQSSLLTFLFCLFARLVQVPNRLTFFVSGSFGQLRIHSLPGLLFLKPFFGFHVVSLARKFSPGRFGRQAHQQLAIWTRFCNLELEEAGCPEGGGFWSPSFGRVWLISPSDQSTGSIDLVGSPVWFCFFFCGLSELSPTLFLGPFCMLPFVNKGAQR